MKSYRYILALALVALLTASGVHSAPQNASVYLPIIRSSLPAIVSPATVVLSATTMASLGSVSPNGVLTFTNTTADLARVKVGSVIVAQPAAAAPDGLIRRVTGVTVQSGQTILQTRQAALDEVFDQVEAVVDGAIPLAPPTIAASAHPSAIICAAGTPYSVSVATGVLLEGTITISRPTFHLEVARGRSISIRHLRFTVSASATVDAKLTLSPEAATGTFEINLLKCKTAPIIVVIAGVPVPIVPELKLSTGVELTQAGGVIVTSTSEARVTGQFTAGIDYLNGTVSTIRQSNVSPSLVQVPPPGGAAKLFAGFSVGLLLGGVLGPEAGIDAYARWDLETDPLSVYVGLEATVKVAIDLVFVSFQPASASITLFERRFALSLPSTTRVSVASNNAQANNDSIFPAISSDGRYVTFYSRANNLVPGDTNNVGDVFLRDRQTGQTTRVSVASDGAQSNGDIETSPSISADSRYIAFDSVADNLVPGDTNNLRDIFIHDRQTGQTTRVSIASDGTQADGSSYDPSISADGRYIAFASAARNLIPNDTNSWDDVFVHDRQTGQTTRVSVASGGVQAEGGTLIYGLSIAANGRYVAFSTDHTNLVLGDTNSVQDVFVHDRQTGQTTRVSVASNGSQGNIGSSEPSISADGRYVAFYSGASNLVSGDTNNVGDTFLHDRQTGQTTRVSVASNGTQGNAYVTSSPSISADGRYVAFSGEASNLVANDTNGVQDVFVHDRQTGQTTRVSVDSNNGQGNAFSTGTSISADGRYVAFWSGASNLVSGDTNAFLDIFLRDRGSLAVLSSS